MGLFQNFQNKQIKDVLIYNASGNKISEITVKKIIEQELDNKINIKIADRKIEGKFLNKKTIIIFLIPDNECRAIIKFLKKVYFKVNCVIIYDVRELFSILSLSEYINVVYEKELNFILNLLFFILNLIILPVYIIIFILVFILSKLPFKFGYIPVYLFQPQRNAGSRYRIYKMFENLKNKYKFIFLPISNNFFNNIFYDALFNPRKLAINKFYYFFIVYPKRLIDILFAGLSKKTIIFYEVFPFFNSYYFRFEKYIYLLNKKVIYDIDDYLLIFDRFKRWYKKFLKDVEIIITGNDYIKQKLQTINKDIEVIPTCIDLERYSKYVKIQPRQNRKIIGWIGNPFNLFYLKLLQQPLKRLAEKYDFTFKVITDSNYYFYLENVEIEFKRWELNKELEDLQTLDIGVMPIIDDEIGRGKCGFKLLQYMALGIPAIASPIGINKKIIQKKINGFLAETEEQWYDYLELLLTDMRLYNSIKENALKTVETFAIEKYQKKWDEILNS